MGLVYITGISGTGKSTICDELKKRGFDAFDADGEGFKAWYNSSTGTYATDQKAWEDTTVTWRKRYHLKVNRSKVQELAELSKHQTKPVFLCGTTPNDKDIWDLFDMVISLSISNEALTDRLKNRTNNDYGKHPDDLRDILGWNETIDQRMKDAGALIFNCDKPLNDVVDEILEKITIQ